MINVKCNECICQRGSWSCTKNKCPGKCSIIGSSSVVTFDKLVYNFEPQCQQYTLLVLPGLFLDMNIVLGVIQSLDLKLTSSTMKIKRDFSVLIDSVEKEKPIREHDFHVRQLSIFTLEVELYGVVITWTPNQIDETLDIQVDPIHADKTVGICGTFNWNQKDDFLTLEGDVEFASDRFVERFTNCMQTVPAQGNNQYLTQCDLHPDRRDKFVHLCSLLPSSIANCRFLHTVPH